MVTWTLWCTVWPQWGKCAHQFFIAYSQPRNEKKGHSVNVSLMYAYVELTSCWACDILLRPLQSAALKQLRLVYPLRKREGESRNETTQTCAYDTCKTSVTTQTTSSLMTTSVLFFFVWTFMITDIQFTRKYQLNIFISTLMPHLLLVSW